MGSVATLYRTNPVKSANANAKEAAKYFRRNFMRCSHPRHFSAEGHDLYCQPSKRDLRSRLGQRMLLVGESRSAFNPGQRLPNDAPVAIMTARPLLHQTFVRRPAFRNPASTKTAICRASVRKVSRTCRIVTRASFDAETGSISDSTFFCWSGELAMCGDRATFVGAPTLVRLRRPFNDERISQA